AREREADTLTGSLEELEKSSAQLAEELEHVRAQQQTQEKGALALDHEQRQLAEEYARSGQRLSVARQEREQSQAAVAQREQERFDQEKALELARGEYEGLQTHAHSVGEEHAHV